MRPEIVRTVPSYNGGDLVVAEAHDEALGQGPDGVVTELGHVKATCGDCRYATVAPSTTEPVVECRRYPPTALPVASLGPTWSDAAPPRFAVDWPVVPVTAWCGEHRWHPDQAAPEPETDKR